MPELLVRAVNYWQISGSALPPTKDEILGRNMVWDDECFIMRIAMEREKDKPKHAAHLASLGTNQL